MLPTRGSSAAGSRRREKGDAVARARVSSCLRASALRPQAFEQLDWAVHEGGINFIDTAELYPVPPRPETAGRTEEMIGRWLAKGGDELRKKIILASKVAGYSKGRGYIVEKRRQTLGTEVGDPQSFATHLSRDQILEACDASLKRLQVLSCCSVQLATLSLEQPPSALSPEPRD